MSHNAKVSKLNFTKKEGGINRSAKHAPPNVYDDSVIDFSVRELETAMKIKGASGPDIPPAFLFKALGLRAKQQLLRLINTS